MKKKEETERLRRQYTKGGRGQTMVTFRLDNENAEWLNAQSNKGRAINNLIAAARAKGAGEP